ncbi:hypothetical protein NV379_02405 [Paenibacillus sp. N1-5-1-14]|uniref:hypothetical protein n=1 Tax=Paenibacillus radicibacter TaxID=2972488 RepID=UPI0021594B79|nr:hypothetical protein [Paenibacillus radicibacter]MCR8641499.1 hypothetical protein [Paenibacillus radicibacter]
MKATGFKDKNNKEIHVETICYYDEAELEIYIVEENGVYYADPRQRDMEREPLEQVAQWLRIIE